MVATQAAGAASRTQTGGRFGNELAAATFVPLLLVAVVALTSSFDAAILWLIGIVATPHVLAGFAFYLDPDARPVLAADRRRYILAPVVIIVTFAAFGGVATALDPRVPATAVIGFVVWQFHHFSRQNYGVLSLALRAWGLERVTDREARLIRLGGWASMAAVSRPLRPVLGPSLIPDAVVDAAFVVGLALMVTAVVEVGRCARDGAGGRRLALLAGLTAFHVPLFATTGPMALTLHAVAHPFQYGLIMWKLRGGRERRQKVAMTAVLLLLATAGAWVVNHTTASDTPFVGVLAGVGLGVVSWHFVLDAGVWKLSKPEPRAYMRRRFAWL